MKTRAMFAGVFAVLLALTILPGAFAQQTGASPEAGAEEEMPEIYRRGIISALYVWFAYEMFPILGKIFKVMQAPGYEFMGISGFELSARFFVEPLGRITEMLGFERAGEVLVDTMTGASPKMTPAFYYCFGEICAQLGLSSLAQMIHGWLLALIEFGHIIVAMLEIYSPFWGFLVFSLWDEILTFMIGGIRHELWPEYYEPNVIIRLNRAGGAIAL
jgi:hypothetical protein